MTIYEDKGTEWILQGPFNINIEGMQSTLTAQHTYKRLSYLYKTYIYIYTCPNSTLVYELAQCNN